MKLKIKANSATLDITVFINYSNIMTKQCQLQIFLFLTNLLTMLSTVHCTSTYNKHYELQTNQIIQDINFFPINSLRFRLSELKNFKAAVIVMRDTDCILSEKYGFYLKILENKYSKHGVLFIYNYVGQKNQKRKAEEDLKKFGFKGPYLIDRKNTITDMLSARKTGDVFILNPNRKILYKGPLNRHFLKSLFSRKNDYVSNILNNIISGKQVTPKKLPSVGRTISRPQIKETVFYKDIKHIIRSKCVNCHNPSGDAIIDLSTYENLINHHAMIKHVIGKNLMPPWPVDPNTGPYINDLSLTTYEKALLMKWLSSGLKQKKRDLSTLQTEMSTVIQNPDYIINLPEKITIPSTGYMPLKQFSVITPFKTDKWIKEIQFINKPKVVHHIIFSIDPRDDKKHKHNQPLCLIKHEKNSPCLLYGAGWSPGRIKHRNLLDVGIKLPKNSRVFVEIHYEPIGIKVIDDTTAIRLSFHKTPPKHQLIKVAVRDMDIKIPPGASNYKSNLVYKIKSPLTLIAIKSHMHLRGLASSIFLTVSGRTKKIFSSVWNFNFQRFYYFKFPIKLKKNSTLTCINWFDNSSKNVINPNPKKEIFWGTRTEDEMSVCAYSFILPVSKNPFDIL